MAKSFDMKRYKILKYPWHTAHDYELAKLPHQFFFLSNTHRKWSYQQRPVPELINWVASEQDCQSDLMILHLDHWSYTQPSKRFLFLKYRDAYSGPKIVINHGCNMVDGCSAEIMRELTQGTYVVCNSSKAHDLWALPNSRFIRHGMSPEDWPATSYERNNIIVVQPTGEFYRAYNNHAGIEHAERSIDITWIGRDIGFRFFDDYRSYLGKSSVYFHPSFASPNPRARTEAMLSGLAIVSTAMHGEEEYIENGVNGFISNDIDELTDYLRYLRSNPEKAKSIGRAGRASAQKLFHIDSFIGQWNDLLREYVN